MAQIRSLTSAPAPAIVLFATVRSTTLINSLLLNNPVVGKVFPFPNFSFSILIDFAESSAPLFHFDMPIRKSKNSRKIKVVPFLSKPLNHDGKFSLQNFFPQKEHLSQPRNLMPADKETGNLIPVK